MVPNRTRFIAPQGTQERVAAVKEPKPPELLPRLAYVEIGAKAIYEMRSHPRKAAWEKAAPEVRAEYRKWMEAVVESIRAHGFVILVNARQKARLKAASEAAT